MEAEPNKRLRAIRVRRFARFAFSGRGLFLRDGSYGKRYEPSSGSRRNFQFRTLVLGRLVSPLVVDAELCPEELLPPCRETQLILERGDVGDTKYQINLSSTAPNALVSQGMPRMVRAGVQVSRFQGLGLRA